MDNYFCAENLFRVWDSVTVDLSFTATRGSMTVIVGKSGSGKSTVLCLIAGLEEPSGRNDRKECSITLGGKELSKLAPGKRGIGMVFQSPALFSHLTVAGNVAYALRCKGIGKKKAEAEAEKYIAEFALTDFGGRMPDTLSGGEAQRVSLARTLIAKPPLVLFDEPLSSLDAPLRKKLAYDIRKSQKREGFTGIFVTHDIAEAKAVADKIIVLESGRKKWEGLPKDFSEAMLE